MKFIESLGKLASLTPLHTAELVTPTDPPSSPGSLIKRLRGGLVFVLGYMLSPLSWWNDIIFNLPIAYLFGYLCRFISADWFIPGLIAGYWLSNLLGVLLMQMGAVEVFQDQSKARNLKKELLVGILSSTAYSLVIFALVYFKVVDLNAFLDLSMLFNR